eukprot:11359955-Prorocentrum_lima.AAC.1
MSLISIPARVASKKPLPIAEQLEPCSGTLPPTLRTADVMSAGNFPTAEALAAEGRSGNSSEEDLARDAGDRGKRDRDSG